MPHTEVMPATETIKMLGILKGPHYVIRKIFIGEWTFYWRLVDGKGRSLIIGKKLYSSTEKALEDINKIERIMPKARAVLLEK